MLHWPCRGQVAGDAPPASLAAYHVGAWPPVSRVGVGQVANDKDGDVLDGIFALLEWAYRPYDHRDGHRQLLERLKLLPAAARDSLAQQLKDYQERTTSPATWAWQLIFSAQDAPLPLYRFNDQVALQVGEATSQGEEFRLNLLHFLACHQEEGYPLEDELMRPRVPGALGHITVYKERLLEGELRAQVERLERRLGHPLALPHPQLHGVRLLPGIVSWDVWEAVKTAPLHVSKKAWQAFLRLRKDTREAMADKLYDVSLSAHFETHSRARPRGAPPYVGLGVEGHGFYLLYHPEASTTWQMRRLLEEEKGYGAGIYSRRSQGQIVSLEGQEADEEGRPLSLAAPSTDPADSLAVREAIRRLPKELQAAVKLVYHEELTQEEAAARLGISRQALSKRLKRAIEMLRRLLSS